MWIYTSAIAVGSKTQVQADGGTASGTRQGGGGSGGRIAIYTLTSTSNPFAFVSAQGGQGDSPGKFIKLKQTQRKNK